MTNQVKSFKDLMEINEFGFYRARIINGDYTLTIIAGLHTMCTPKNMISSSPIEEFTHMEMSVGKNGGFTDFTDSFFDDFEKKEIFLDHEDSVYGYIEVELLQELYEYFISRK